MCWVCVGVCCRLKTLLGPLEAIFSKPETTILERLRVGAGWQPNSRGPDPGLSQYCLGSDAVLLSTGQTPGLVQWAHGVSSGSGGLM